MVLVTNVKVRIFCFMALQTCVIMRSFDFLAFQAIVKYILSYIMAFTDLCNISTCSVS